ncbi:MAG: DUF5908 family protein [Chitinophagaceae bacterium]
MPVQINEVIVRAVVDPRPAEEKGGAMDCPPSGNSGDDAEIVEKVLEIIKEKNER